MRLYRQQEKQKQQEQMRREEEDKSDLLRKLQEQKQQLAEHQRRSHPGRSSGRPARPARRPGHKSRRQSRRSKLPNSIEDAATSQPPQDVGEDDDDAVFCARDVRAKIGRVAQLFEAAVGKPSDLPSLPDRQEEDWDADEDCELSLRYTSWGRLEQKLQQQQEQQQRTPRLRQQERGGRRRVVKDQQTRILREETPSPNRYTRRKARNSGPSSSGFKKADPVSRYHELKKEWDSLGFLQRRAQAAH